MLGYSSTRRPKLIIFSSGSREDGGSGFENLVNASREGTLDAEIVAVVSNQEKGAVRERADHLGIPFIYFGGETHSNVLKNIRMRYREIVEKSGADWAALSGWLRHVKGLDPKTTFNIHPALLSQLNRRFGGSGMYGARLYEAIKTAVDAGEITESGCSMHFVTEEYDRGQIFFEYRIPLQKGMSVDAIEKAIRKVEHKWQPKITNMVVHGQISWDGKNPKSLVVPPDYQYLPKR